MSSVALAINISSKILLIFKMFQERQKTIDGRYLSSMVHSGCYPMGTKPIKTLEFYVFNDQFLKIRDINDLAVKANKLDLNIAKKVEVHGNTGTRQRLTQIMTIFLIYRQKAIESDKSLVLSIEKHLTCCKDTDENLIRN